MITLHHWKMKDGLQDEEFDESEYLSDWKELHFPPDCIKDQLTDILPKYRNDTRQTKKAVTTDNGTGSDQMEGEDMTAESEDPPSHMMIGNIGKRSSTIAITGEGRGELWTCLILSSMMSSEEVEEYVEDLPMTLSMFIHQQPSGRCLAFFVLLGHLCNHLHWEYENILKELTTVVDIGVRLNDPL
jgi:hypothetical protein